MTYPPAWPTSQIGQLESEIRNVKSDLSRKADDHEVHSALSRLDSLEHTVGEISSTLAGFGSRLQAIQEALRTAADQY